MPAIPSCSRIGTGCCRLHLCIAGRSVLCHPLVVGDTCISEAGESRTWRLRLGDPNHLHRRRGRFFCCVFGMKRCSSFFVPAPLKFGTPVSFCVTTFFPAVL